MMSETINGQIPPWLREYLDRGFRLLVFPIRTKGPNEKSDKGWRDRVFSPGDYHEGKHNIGVFTGTEIEPGKFLVDVDFDWTEGLALAKRIIPRTDFGFGRESRTISHAFFTTSEPVKSKAFDDITGKPFVEIRGTKADGGIGFETMIPPSIHPTGEQIILRANGPIAHDDTIPRKVMLYAIACMLYQHLGHRGLLHDTRLAVAGFLLSEGLTEDEVILIAESVAEVSGNNIADVSSTVQTTAARIRANQRVLGRGSLIKALGEVGKDVVSRIKDWIGGGQFVTDDKDRIIANNQDNIRRALQRLGVQLSFDSFAERPLITYNGYTGNLTDQISRRVWLDIDTTFHFRPSMEFFDIVVESVYLESTFHPVKDYLQSLTWDGKPRVNTWLIDYAKAADSAYARAVSSLVLIAAVHRVMSPGCKFDEMLVLESPQGFTKSSMLRALCPKDEWFSDDLPLNVEAKQIIERTVGKWIIEASDLSGMGKRDIEHLKAFLSRQRDGPVRLAYAKLPTEAKRQFVIIGTTNQHRYLKDMTGNRRFWPVRIEQIDLAGIRANRDQIWAEAYHREQQGESIRLNPELYGIASLQQERRRAEDPWEDILEESFPLNEKIRKTPEEIWTLVHMPVERRTERDNARLSEIMQRLGFRRLTVEDKDLHRRVKGWARDPVEGQGDLLEN
jgi:predicted P-loop ATPase